MCCISSEPITDPRNRIKTFNGRSRFQTPMLTAPCAGGCSPLWFCGQFFPLTCGCTQYFLRRKVLNYDMTKYTCFQGYFNCCCFQAGSCGESSCPDCCLCIEAHLCNFVAVSASRIYVMEKYDLTSDPCDYRLIRINNCIQVMACVVTILAIFMSELKELSHILNLIADLVYHSVSGCMTAQVAYEVDWQIRHGSQNYHGHQDTRNGEDHMIHAHQVVVVNAQQPYPAKASTGFNTDY